LQWQAATNTNLPKAPLINAGLPNETVNICRAAFLGAYVQTKAVYPGQLTSGGCRISYAGYAFTVTKFEALTGVEAGLQWIPMADVKKSAQTKMQQLPVTSQIARGPLFAYPPARPFNFDVKINNASPVAGGYEGGNPVLICRTHQDGTTIGKVVFFDGTNGQKQDACDIGVDDQEVVIENNYDVLFWAAK
jgi:hypothetical protein